MSFRSICPFTPYAYISIDLNIKTSLVHKTILSFYRGSFEINPFNKSSSAFNQSILYDEIIGY